MNDTAATDSALEALHIDRTRSAGRRRGPRLGTLVVVLLACGVVGVLLVMGPLRGLMLTEVRTAVVQRIAATKGLVRTSASGYVVARRRAALSSRLSGRLDELLVDVGDRVETGQLIGKLGHDDLDASVAEARARIAQREQDVLGVERDRDTARTAVEWARQRLADAELQVALQETRVTEARRLLAVEERLVANGVSTGDERDRLQAGRDVALRELEAMRGLVETSRKEVAREEALLAAFAPRIDGARAALEAEHAALARAVALRADADIRAPFAGVVLRKEAEVGEMVAPVNASGSTTRGALVTIADFASLEMEVDVIERDIAHVKAGTPCRIVLDARRDAPYLGRVRQVVPTADRTRGTVQVKIAFDHLDEFVLPEMGGRVDFLEEEGAAKALDPDRIETPAAALTERGGVAGVFVLEGGAVKFRAVEASAPSGGVVQVRSGLAGGEAVVLDPQTTLSDGAAVAPVGAD